MTAGFPATPEGASEIGQMQAASASPGLAALVRAADASAETETMTAYPPTAPMPAVGTLEPAPLPEPPADRCRCGMAGCPDGPPVPLMLGGDPRALLYCGPGIVDRTWRARVREGAWEDIPGLFDEVQTRFYLGTRNGKRRIHRDLGTGGHRLAVAFGANPELHDDVLLSGLLHSLEGVLRDRLEDERRRSGQRWGTAAGRAA